MPPKAVCYSATFSVNIEVPCIQTNSADANLAVVLLTVKNGNVETDSGTP